MIFFESMGGLSGTSGKTNHFVKNVIYARTPYDGKLFDIDLIPRLNLQGIWA